MLFDTELGLLSCGNHLLVMACANTGIDTYGALSAGIEGSEKFELFQTVKAGHDVMIDGKL